MDQNRPYGIIYGSYTDVGAHLLEYLVKKNYFIISIDYFDCRIADVSFIIPTGGLRKPAIKEALQTHLTTVLKGKQLTTLMGVADAACYSNVNAYNALEELFHAMRRETSHATNYLANLACTFLDETGVLVFAAEAPYIGIFWPRFSYSVAKRGVIQLNNIMKKQKHGFGAGESIRIYPSGSLVKDCGWISKGGFMRWFADNDFIMYLIGVTKCK